MSWSHFLDTQLQTLDLPLAAPEHAEPEQPPRQQAQKIPNYALGSQLLRLEPETDCESVAETPPAAPAQKRWGTRRFMRLLRRRFWWLSAPQPILRNRVNTNFDAEMANLREEKLVFYESFTDLGEARRQQLRNYTIA